MEDCVDSMSEEEIEKFFLKIAGRVKPEVHLRILTEAFGQLSGSEKEKVREILFGKEYAELKKFIKECKEIQKEYEAEKGKSE